MSDERTERSPTRRARITARVRSELSTRLSPERTRRATTFERLTVGRLSWDAIIRLNRYLEFFGKLTTAAYGAFVLTVIFGANWRNVVEDAFNAGDPVRGAIILVIALPTLSFVALHSVLGWGRWRLQRELWRRDVAQMSSVEPG